MYPRHISSQIKAALADSPVVLLHGARQTGKSTLVQHLAAKDHPARYLTLDDATVLAAAQTDPAGFLAGLDGAVAIDEVQRAPGLFMAIKADVDRRRRPGRFLLTGSANVLMVPRLSECLTGRMEILTLWPLSQGEIEGKAERFIDVMFAGHAPEFDRAVKAGGVVTRALAGGYPEVLARPLVERRQAWFGSYVSTILQRDVRDLAHINGLTAMPRLLALLAARVGTLANHSEFARGLAMPQSTLKRYMSLLEATFLVQSLPPWSTNRGKRLVKSPKLYLIDTGLAASLLGAGTVAAGLDGAFIGPLIENFVVMELRKQIAWSRIKPAMFHFRTTGGQEVDIVLEDAGGRVVGIEVKSGRTLGEGDFKGLRALAEQAGEKFQRGVVLYDGEETVSFGDRLLAMPMEALWQT